MTFSELWKKLTPDYDEQEARAIVRILLEDGFGMSFTDIICGGLDRLSTEQKTSIERLMRRLCQGEPVQYVIGKASFLDRSFIVTPDVLIPRPETEDLCNWITKETKEPSTDILDIGTGSGCIGTSLALDIPSSHVTVWDISDKALLIADKNARQLGADITTVLQDALNPPSDVRQWDIIVSNPPYICDMERKDMERNVLEHEPHTALFVPDDNPLLFYSAIARYARQALRPKGSLYFEINPVYEKELLQMLSMEGFTHISIKKDRFGKVRFVKAESFSALFSPDTSKHQRHEQNTQK